MNMKIENCLNCNKHKFNSELGDFCKMTKEVLYRFYAPPCKDYKKDTQYEEYDDNFILGEN